MTRNGQPNQQRQVLIARFSCRQCRFTSVDVEGIRRHANSHMLEAAINIHSQRQTEQTRQLRERNLLFNPFRQLLPSPTQSTRRNPRRNRTQMQRSTQGSEARRPPIQTQLVQAAQHSASHRTQETSDAFLMPLINQLDYPIPVIIDLDSDQIGDASQIDLTLRL